jgi:predicted amidohydrolase YtcJ
LKAPFSTSSAPDEILFVGGRIRATSAGPPADALLVRGDRVAAVGPESRVRAAASPGHRLVRVDGMTVTAGLTDAHVHLTTWALARRQVVLAGSTSVAEAAERAAAHAGSASGWVLGQGWNRHLWSALPTRHDLDRLVPDRPVFLDSQDIHAAWLNSEALRRCDVTRDTPDPEGGTIVRDEAGEPTGLLLENARSMALARVPAPSAAEIRQALWDAQAEAHRLGITGVHSVEADGLADFSAMEERGELRLRVLQHIQLHHLEAAVRVGLRSGFGSEWLRIGGVKMFLDGSLGSRTAWLREPYLGEGGDVGIQTLSTGAFRDAVALAADRGLPSTVHAIGDAAVSLALEVLGAHPAPGRVPHRIEHVQLCPPDLWTRAGRSGVVGSMQPVHLLTDIAPAERLWGSPRTRGAYPFGALHRAGMLLAFGSDVPVETLDPRPGLFAARRRMPWSAYEGEGGGEEWYPEHRLSGEEALGGYTEGPAAAAGAGRELGRLLPRYRADLVVWDRDPVECPADELRLLRTRTTMVGGQIVFTEQAQ